MPIYEYYCPDNNKIYQFFAKTLAQGQTVPKCPDNHAYRMEKIVSAFAVTGTSKKSKEPAEAGAPAGQETPADDPRMEAAMAAMHGNPGPELPYGMRFYRTGKLLHLELPSGRVLRYFRPFLTTNRFGGDSIGYESYDTGVWGTVETYGAKLVENIVQAIARDCLRDTMLRVEPFWPEIVMHIHDEVVIEVPKEQAQIALDHVTSIMGEAISWAPGLLLRGDGYLTDYYRKD